MTTRSRQAVAALVLIVSLTHWTPWRTVRRYDTIGSPIGDRSRSVEVVGTGLVPLESLDLGVTLRPGDRMRRVERDDLVCWEISRMSGEALLLLGIPLDLNEDSEHALSALPGVGPVTAGRIVARRPYQRAAELLEVRGIGPATFAKIHNHVTIRRPREISERRACAAP